MNLFRCVFIIQHLEVQWKFFSFFIHYDELIQRLLKSFVYRYRIFKFSALKFNVLTMKLSYTQVNGFGMRFR